MKLGITNTGTMVVTMGTTLFLIGTALTSAVAQALGFALIAVVLASLLRFLPQAQALARRQVLLELTHSSPSAPVPGRPLSLSFRVLNRSARVLPGLRIIPALSTRLVCLEEPCFGPVAPCTEAVGSLPLEALSMGRWNAHGATLALQDPLAIFEVRRYFPSPVGLRVLPSLVSNRKVAALGPRMARIQDRVGLQRLPHPGMGTDLKEIRDHQPSDPYRSIDWKASARLGHLMVRQFEDEVRSTLQILLDISPTMRTGLLGETKLDQAVRLVSTLANLALYKGHRVGLITFDWQLRQALRPASGKEQLYRIIHHLLVLHSLVDREHTDLTDPEVAALVVRYIRQETGTPLELLADEGEIHDDDPAFRMLMAYVRRYLTALGEAPPEEPGEALRRYCFLRGIELPKRLPELLASKDQGLAQAVEAGARERGSRLLVVVSDLIGFEDGEEATRTLALVGQRNRSVMLLVPSAPFLPQGYSPLHQAIEEIMRHNEARMRRSMRSAVRAQGIPLVDSTDGDALASVIHRLARVSRGGR